MPVYGFRIGFTTAMLLSLVSAPVCSAADRFARPESALAGVVRDTHGVPQMGAVVELVGVGGGVRSLITGIDGQFAFTDLLAGTYRLRASASLLRPASSHAVRVMAGAHAVVNLTLGNLYDAGAWLPADRRNASEPSDDWMWTMRSGASRPVLRLAGGGRQQPAEGWAAHGPVPIAVGLVSRTGGFGGTGVSQTVSAGYTAADGTRQMAGSLRYGVSSRSTGQVPIAMRITVVRQSSPWSDLASAVQYDSDPQVQTAGGTRESYGFLRISSAESVRLGDAVAFEIGGMLVSDRTRPGAMASRPFGRVRAHLGKGWSVGYAGATDRSLQQASDVKVGKAWRAAAEDASSLLPGRIEPGRIEHGRHDMLSLRGEGERRRMLVSFYRDDLRTVPLAGEGSGRALAAVLGDAGVAGESLIDQANGTFRTERAGYRAEGCQVVLSEAWAPQQTAEVSFRTGAALALGASGTGAPDVLARLRRARAVSVGVATQSRVRRTGTVLRVAYQWQPEDLLTPVDPFDVEGRPAYLGFSLEQRLPESLARRGGTLSISATNVLRQGMHAFVLGDGSTVTLAQALPVLQAGVGFTF